MGIFDRFPYSSTHEMNLDFMLGKATEIAEDMQTVTTGMAQVQAGLSAISEKTEQATQAAAQAAQSASSIEGSVTAAEEAAEEARMHNESAQTWANNAMTYKADCQRSATEAAASSSSAAQAATAAAASEDTVAQYAQAANASAQSAANNNDSAHQYANQASASASNATFHSSNAQTAATNAQTAATNANTSATNAAASADRAAFLKTDVETLHRMCVTAVDQAAAQAVAAGNSAGQAAEQEAAAANSAAQAAATKTDVENLVESLPEDFTDLNNTVNQLSDEIDNLNDEVFYRDVPTLTWVSGVVANAGSTRGNAGDKTSQPFLLKQGETVKVKTKGDGAFMFNVISSVANLDVFISPEVSVYCTRLIRLTANTLTEYSYTAENDIPIIISCLDDPTTVVEFENIAIHSNFDRLQTEIDENSTIYNGILKNKSVMFFGDSLTAASTAGVAGFAHRIADAYGMPYKLFVYDSGDNNPADTPVNFPRFTNYGKDGTCNRVRSGQTDSVLERVKRHITADTLIDYVLIECCVNDMAASNRNKGQISESYTDAFDTSTTIGAIEETLRYLTTLGKPIRVGAFIPWLIGWETPGWFDDYIPVFEKWGVPIFDMRKTAGFNMYSCAAHRRIYSLTSENYSTWDSATTYNLDDKVKYGGILYKCLTNNVTGIVPTNTEYWMPVSSEANDATHLNNIGHFVVTGKIQKFIEAC